MPWDHLPEALQPIALHDPEREVLRRESLNQLRVLVAGLDGDKQELLALRFAAGLSIHEIARLLGKSDAAVQKALWRLVESLREQYDER